MTQHQILLIALVCAGCKHRPAMPSEHDAREVLRKTTPGLEQLTALVETEISRAKLVANPPACAPDAENRRDCATELSIRSTSLTNLKYALEEKLPLLADRMGALAISGEIRLTDTLAISIDLPPCHAYAQTTDYYVSGGATAGAYRLGWGKAFQTSWSAGGTEHGDGELHPGVDVHWEFPHDPVKVALTVCFLLDGTPRPP